MICTYSKSEVFSTMLLSSQAMLTKQADSCERSIQISCLLVDARNEHIECQGGAEFSVML